MIRLNQVGIEFDDQWIFKDLDLSIASQESFVIVGPSGSGKSVLLKMLAGLIEPSAGTITVEEDNIGMLFQKNALFDSFTVEENLRFPLEEKKRSNDLELSEEQIQLKIKSFLEELALSGCEALYPDELSGGMQKRLGIARALIVEPKLILYDEPTAGLDPITSRRIARMICRLKETLGSTLITVTNDMERAYQIGDRLGLLAGGTLTVGGTPDQVRMSTDPALRQFTQGLTEGPLTGGLE